MVVDVQRSNDSGRRRTCVVWIVVVVLFTRLFVTGEALLRDVRICYSPTLVADQNDCETLLSLLLQQNVSMYNVQHMEKCAETVQNCYEPQLLSLMIYAMRR